MPVRNTLVQLLAVYLNPESHNAQRHRQTDRQSDRQTDGQQDDANSRSYCVAVRSLKNRHCFYSYVLVLASLQPSCLLVHFHVIW